MLDNQNILRLNIGDVAIARGQSTFICHGLASCIAVFIYEKYGNLAGGAHIFLPDRHADTYGCAEPTLQKLISEICKRGAEKLLLRAKLTGGSQLFSQDSFKVGERNAISVKQFLKNMSIPITGEDIGGTHCRTAQFHFPDSNLEVRSSRGNKYLI